jgi:subfamily B ATP-binding cassette protein MsbA
MLEYKGLFVIALTGTIMVAGGTAAVPYLIQPVLDDIFINHDRQMLYLLPAAIIIVHLIKGVGYYLQAYYTAYIGEDIIRRIRDGLLSNLVSLELAFFHGSRKGTLISRITNDTSRIQSVVSVAIPQLVRDILTIFALLGVVIYQNPKLAFLGLIVMPLAAWPLSKLSKRMRRLSKTSQIKVGNMTSRLSEIFHNVEVIKGSNAEAFEQERFGKDNHEFFRYTMKTVKTNKLISPLMEFLGSIGVAIVILIGGLQVIDGQMSVGSFFSFMTALFMLYGPIKSVSRLYNSLQDAVAASDRIFEFLDLSPTILSGKEPLKGPIDSVCFEDVHVHYGETHALKGVSFEVRTGEKIALVGQSGGGKSTLINLLPRFIDPSQGQIRFNNIPITQLEIPSLRDHIGMVTQQVFLFGDSVAANVAYGHAIDEARVVEALKEANAWEFVEKMESGIHTQLSEGGVNLSGGQKQRLSIARAIYKDPAIFILDEATSALDNESEARVQEALERVTAGKITFIIAHRLSTIKNADRIILLHDGAIRCMGSESELLKNCPAFIELKNGGAIT